LEREVTVEGFGTASLSRLVSSPNVKSVSEKCRLQTYCLDCFLALQGIPSLSAHSQACVKMEPENIEMKLFLGLVPLLYPGTECIVDVAL